MAKMKPIKIITLDTETYNGLIGRLKRIAIYDGENVTYGYTFEDVEPYLLKLKRKYKLHIYIHNMEFDLRKIPAIFDKSRIIWEKSFIINGKLATVSCKDYILHDSFKILPMALSKLSKDFGVEHGKLDLCQAVLETYPKQYEIYDENGKVDRQETLVNFLDKCPVDDPLYLKYLGYDVISLYEIINILIDVSGLEVKDFVKKMSTASISRHIFKNGYKGKVFKHEDKARSDYDIMCGYKWQFDLNTEEFIRCSYAGGRTEVFKPKLETQGYYNDVNSLYPFVMLKEYPIGEPEFISNPKVSQHYFETWLEDHMGLGFICCTVFIPPQAIPPLPIKMGKLCFPTGVAYGTFTYIELEYAIKNCGVKIIEYREVCHFARTFKVFENFITEMYTIKEQGGRDGNEALRTFGKLLMNVGYGYTGMSRDKTKLVPLDKIGEYPNYVYRDDERGFLEVPADVKSEYIQVQIASYVTSYGRLVLLDAMRKASEYCNVYYCDTDSMITDAPLPPEMVDPFKLGAWDVEAKPIAGIFLKPKVYALIVEEKEEEKIIEKSKVKFKGISKETQKNLTFDDYEMLYKELQEMKKDSIVIEKNKLMLRSIMFLEKNGQDLSSYEYRDKKMNLNTVEKRNMFYSENFTTPIHFETEKDFEDFSFKPKRKINISEF